MSVKSIRTSFGCTWISRGNVAVDLQENALVVGKRKKFLYPAKARILAVILDNTRNGCKLTMRMLGQSLGYSCPEVFNKTFDSLLKDIEEVSIANEGGLDSAFEYPTIFAPSLFCVESGRISFHAALAAKITQKNTVSEKALTDLAI